MFWVCGEAFEICCKHLFQDSIAYPLQTALEGSSLAQVDFALCIMGFNSGYSESPCCSYVQNSGQASAYRLFQQVAPTLV